MIKSKFLNLSVGFNPYTLHLNIDPLTLSVAGGLNLFNGIMSNKNTKATNKTNLQIARENNEMAYRMFNEGNEFNRQMAIDMFNMENEYNDPAAVRERLENAGYNPFLSDDNAAMVNQGDASTPTSVAPPTLSTPTMMTPPAVLNGVLDSLADITLKSAQAKKLGAETNTIDSVRDKLVKEYEINNDAKQWELALSQAFEPMLKSLEGSEKAAQVKKLQEDILLTHQNYVNAVVDGDIKVEERELRKLDKLMKNQELKFLPDTLREQLSNLKKQGREIDSRTNYNNSAAYNQRTGALSNVASAMDSLQRAKTEKELRPFKKWQIVADSGSTIIGALKEVVTLPQQIDKLDKEIKKMDIDTQIEIFETMQDAVYRALSGEAEITLPIIGKIGIKGKK